MYLLPLYRSHNKQYLSQLLEDVVVPFAITKMWWITIAVLLFSVIAWFVLKSLYPGAPPQLDQEEWWGPNDLKGKQDTTIRPFQIKFSEQTKHSSTASTVTSCRVG
ncbi:unnamed protein product [Leptidea sinapis]|uniref:Uncharacterized protein n=1 Tax=Leptidea sinapis TaxID=189913 RepID=A0A5E4QBY0_9NEOP|nr:unnamed protein product [Leptidea sinapis]